MLYVDNSCFAFEMWNHEGKANIFENMWMFLIRDNIPPT